MARHWSVRETARGLRAVALACAWFALAGVPARADDLLDVYAQARSNDPVLAAADAARAGTHDLADQARAALLPQASATAAIGRERDSGATQPTASSHTTDVTLGVNQVVFDAACGRS
jgi:outer membrane protein